MSIQWCARTVEQIAKVKIVELSDEQRRALQDVLKRGSDWCERDRAQTVLLMGQGQTCKQVALAQDLSPHTARDTRSHWRRDGMACLADKPCSGAARKLDEMQIERLAQWAREEPPTVGALQPMHEAAGGKKVHIETLSKVLRQKGFVWKRTRHSLKKTEPSRLRAS